MIKQGLTGLPQRTYNNSYNLQIIACRERTRNNLAKQTLEQMINQNLIR